MSGVVGLPTLPEGYVWEITADPDTDLFRLMLVHNIPPGAWTEWTKLAPKDSVIGWMERFAEAQRTHRYAVTYESRDVKTRAWWGGLYVHTEYRLRFHARSDVLSSTSWTIKPGDLPDHDKIREEAKKLWTSQKSIEATRSAWADVAGTYPPKPESD